MQIYTIIIAYFVNKMRNLNSIMLKAEKYLNLG